MAKKEIKDENPEEIKSVEVSKEAIPAEDIEVVDEIVVSPDELSEDVVIAPDEKDEGEGEGEGEGEIILEESAQEKGPKYVIDESKIDAYLRKGKRFDIISQRQKGGNFIGGRGEIYIPLSLIKK